MASCCPGLSASPKAVATTCGGLQVQLALAASACSACAVASVRLLKSTPSSCIQRVLPRRQSCPRDVAAMLRLAWARRASAATTEALSGAGQHVSGPAGASRWQRRSHAGGRRLCLEQGGQRLNRVGRPPGQRAGFVEGDDAHLCHQGRPGCGIRGCRAVRLHPGSTMMAAGVESPTRRADDEHRHRMHHGRRPCLPRARAPAKQRQYRAMTTTTPGTNTALDLVHALGLPACGIFAADCKRGYDARQRGTPRPPPVHHQQPAAIDRAADHAAARMRLA